MLASAVDEAADNRVLPPLVLSDEDLREVDAISRRSRIALLRHNAEQAAMRATGFVQLGAAGLLAASLLLMVPILIAGGSLAPVALLLTGLVGALSFLYGIAALFSIRADYVSSLHQARQQLGGGLLLSRMLDAGQWQQLCASLHGRLPALLRHNIAPRDFAGHLSYIACHLRSLAELQQTGSAAASRAFKGEMIHLLAPIFHISGPLAVILILGMLIALGLLWPFFSGIPLLSGLLGTLISIVYLLLALAVFLGRDFIASRAALVVICDMLLGSGMEEEF